MKENWLEKLIELLKEYDECRWEKRRKYWWTKDKVELDVKMIIFKKYWFIQRLVENDKIDRTKFYKKSEQIITDFDLKWEYELEENEILMLLSISDTPIDDLLLYLK